MYVNWYLLSFYTIPHPSRPPTVLCTPPQITPRIHWRRAILGRAVTAKRTAQKRSVVVAKWTQRAAKTAVVRTPARIRSTMAPTITIRSTRMKLRCCQQRSALHLPTPTKKMSTSVRNGPGKILFTYAFPLSILSLSFFVWCAESI